MLRNGTNGGRGASIRVLFRNVCKRKRNKFKKQIPTEKKKSMMETRELILDKALLTHNDAVHFQGHLGRTYFIGSVFRI